MLGFEAIGIAALPNIPIIIKKIIMKSGSKLAYCCFYNSHYLYFEITSSPSFTKPCPPMMTLVSSECRLSMHLDEYRLGFVRSLFSLRHLKL